MTCEEVIELMNRNLDQDIQDSEHLAMIRHMQQCPECTELYERLQRLSRDMEELPKVVPPFSIVDSIMPQLEALDSISGQNAYSATASLPWHQRWMGSISWKIAGAVVAAGIVFGIFIIGRAGPDGFSAQEASKLTGSANSAASGSADSHSKDKPDDGVRINSESNQAAGAGAPAAQSNEQENAVAAESGIGSAPNDPPAADKSAAAEGGRTPAADSGKRDAKGTAKPADQGAAGRTGASRPLTQSAGDSGDAAAGPAQGLQEPATAQGRPSAGSKEIAPKTLNNLDEPQSLKAAPPEPNSVKDLASPAYRSQLQANSQSEPAKPVLISPYGFYVGAVENQKVLIKKNKDGFVLYSSKFQWSAGEKKYLYPCGRTILSCTIL